MMPLRDYLRKGIKHETPLLHPGVWQGKARLLDNRLIKKNQVDIDESFTPFLLALAAKLAFNIQG